MQVIYLALLISASFAPSVAQDSNSSLPPVFQDIPAPPISVRLPPCRIIPAPPISDRLPSCRIIPPPPISDRLPPCRVIPPPPISDRLPPCRVIPPPPISVRLPPRLPPPTEPLPPIPLVAPMHPFKPKTNLFTLNNVNPHCIDVACLSVTKSILTQTSTPRFSTPLAHTISAASPVSSLAEPFPPLPNAAPPTSFGLRRNLLLSANENPDVSMNTEALSMLANVLNGGLNQRRKSIAVVETSFSKNDSTTPDFPPTPRFPKRLMSRRKSLEVIEESQDETDIPDPFPSTQLPTHPSIDKPLPEIPYNGRKSSSSILTTFRKIKFSTRLQTKRSEEPAKQEAQVENYQIAQEEKETKSSELPESTPHERKGSIYQDSLALFSKGFDRLSMARLSMTSSRASPTPRLEIKRLDSLDGRSSDSSDASVHSEDVVPRKVDPKKERQEILKELLSTEQRYVAELAHIIEFYKKPLCKHIEFQKSTSSSKQERGRNVSESLPAYEGDLSVQLFMNIDYIYEAHKLILINMTKILDLVTGLKENSADDEAVFDAITNIVKELIQTVSSNEWHDMYSDYYSEFLHATKVMDPLMSENSIYKGLFDGCLLISNNSVPIHGCILVPLQRPPRYALLLKALFKSVSSEENAALHEQLKCAIEVMNETLKSFDDATNAANCNDIKVDQMRKKINGLMKMEEELGVSNRNLIAQGYFFKESGRKFQLRTLILFSDMLAFTNGNKLEDAIRLEQVVPSIDEDGKLLIIRADAKNECCTFLPVLKKASFSIDTAELKKETSKMWIKRIKKAQSQLKIKYESISEISKFKAELL